MTILKQLAAAALVAMTIAGSAARAGDVGYSELKVEADGGSPMTIGVWYPTDAPTAVSRVGAFTQVVARDGPAAGAHLPLIVMSHGNGGSYDNHYDTALALAQAGFVVAAVSHPGDTHEDQSRALFIQDRPRQIHELIDYMLTRWPAHGRIDVRRIGVFGFSSGGFTALVAIGGVPDMNAVAAHTQAHPSSYEAQLAVRASPEIRAEAAAARAALTPSSWVHDPRIKAAVVAAPALGYTFGRAGLETVSVPVQLWRAEDDHILPNPDYAEAVRIALPSPPEFHLVAKADHFDFLAPCSDLLRSAAPAICVSAPGFDRVAFHQTFNREVVRFFRQTLS
jgi:predicted dienelactone hydrolase